MYKLQRAGAKPTELEVTLKWKFLERIAEFYEFPSAVFLGNEKMFNTKTRYEGLLNRANAFDKIQEIVEETE